MFRKIRVLLEKKIKVINRTMLQAEFQQQKNMEFNWQKLYLRINV